MHLMSHIYEATKVRLVEANTGAVDRIFVERFEPIQDTEVLPAIMIAFTSSRLERESSTTRFKGEAPLTIEAVVDGRNGDEAQQTRGELVEEIKAALLAPGSPWPRFVERGGALAANPLWQVVSVSETVRRGRTESARLISTSLLELVLKVQEHIVDLPEDATPFEGIDFDVQTQGPDEAPAEMQFTVEP